MLDIWPKFAQYISKICPIYAQALPKVWGFKFRKWDKMSPGRVHQLGHYVDGKVHNAVGHFVVGTFCFLTFIFILISHFSKVAHKGFVWDINCSQLIGWGSNIWQHLVFPQEQDLSKGQCFIFFPVSFPVFKWSFCINFEIACWT